MKAGRIFMIFLIMVFMSVSFLPVVAAAVDDLRGSAMSVDAGDGSGEEEVFSRNPFVYVAAFWIEIVNAPKERSFFERIMSFLEAVRVRR